MYNSNTFSRFLLIVNLFALGFGEGNLTSPITNVTGIFSNTTTSSPPKTTKEPRVVVLPNAGCMARETIVAIDAPRYIYKPSKVVIHRCDGSFDKMTPSIKKCVNGTSETLKLKVQNIFTMQSELLELENHTSCKPQCVFNGSQCNHFQNWNPEQCLCECNHEKQHECPEHFVWEPSLCQCVCERRCPMRRQYLDEEECACVCKPKFFHRCNRREQILNEDNCTCLEPQAQLGLVECDIIPTKWAVLIIVLSFCALFIIAFDCILYTRHTGCLFHSTHLCQKSKKTHVHEERIPIKGGGHHSDSHV